ncbi:PHD-finger domain-containing protein [Ditylenchus destructor]|nr:PHD-finger domain-containing protein [Ditylenchus destructor]
MSLQTVLDNFMKHLDSLPKDVSKNMTEIRQLDSECTKINAAAQNRARQLVKSWKTLAKDARKKAYDAIRADFNKMKEISDTKIRLASQTYELVDKYIIRLDNDTAKFNACVRKKLAMDGGSQATSSNEQEPEGRKRKSTLGRKDLKKARDKEAVDSDHTQELVPSFGSPAPLVDMPVDPNEPTYCVCHQVSFGEMVMCDNKTCPIEWFHFQCVGLTAKPRGKWFCTRCTELRKKRAAPNK